MKYLFVVRTNPPIYHEIYVTKESQVEEILKTYYAESLGFSFITPGLADCAIRKHEELHTVLYDSDSASHYEKIIHIDVGHIVVYDNKNVAKHNIYNEKDINDFCTDLLTRKLQNKVIQFQEKNKEKTVTIMRVKDVKGEGIYGHEFDKVGSRLIYLREITDGIEGIKVLA